MLNPATPPHCIEWCAHHLDFVLVMTVNPGFGGQKLIPEVIKKIEIITNLYPHLPVCVDGGITTDNITALAFAGASQFVVGSALFGSDNYTQTIAMLHAGGV